MIPSKTFLSFLCQCTMPFAKPLSANWDKHETDDKNISTK